MIAKIAVLDLHQPIKPITIDPRYSNLWLLVRVGYQPLGMLRLPRPSRRSSYTSDHLREAINDQIGWRVWEELAVPSHMPALSPPISVVVCTRDRPESLRRCLADLAKLDYQNYEVIVVDNASRGPETAEVVAERGFRYAREERTGLDWARNCGLDAAKYALVAYTDDDVQVDAGWLRGIAAAFADPQVAAVTGLVLPAEVESQAQALFERYGGMSKGFTPRLFERQRLGDAGIIAAHQCGVGANMAFRRAALMALGGFDTALDVGTPAFGGGDIDIFHRVLAAGLALHYEPSALVWHQHRRDLPGLRRQIYGNGRAFGVYLAKIWRDRSVPRQAVAIYAARWVGGWLVRRVFDSARGRLNTPLRLALDELWGALHAPSAYRETYRRDAEIRRAQYVEPANDTQTIPALHRHHRIDL